MNDEQREHDAEPITRRRFLTALSIGMGGLGAAIAGIPVLGFLFGPLFRREEERWRAVGPLDLYEQGRIVKVEFPDVSSVPWSGETVQTGAWLRRTGAEEFQAFSIFCTHLGCPVLWKPDAQLFLCPCHGGAFYEDGTVASGPPPVPLNQFPVRVRDGTVEVGTQAIEIDTEELIET